jgi:hypothetical protein
VSVLLAGCNAIFDIEPGTPRPVCANALLIDDLEDGDETVCPSDGRDGHWFTFGDGTVGAELIPSSGVAFEPTRIDDGSRSTSRYAARFSGSGFETWASMGLDLVSNPPYDAVGLGGISFWMRSTGPVDVLIGMPETTPTSQGGTCEDPEGAFTCNEHFKFSITAPAPGWAEYRVPFNALRQAFGTVVWNPRRLGAIQFQTPGPAPFDVWIDDLSFYDCAGPECQPTCTDPRFPVSCRPMSGTRSTCQPPQTDCAAVASSCAPPLIDDLEDGDAEICATEGRQGYWYVVDDGTSTDLEPAPGAWLPSSITGQRAASNRAAHVKGAGLSSWGARMGLELNTKATGAAGYDASAADGVTFWMKSTQPVSVELQLLSTVGRRQGGNCDENDEDAHCNEHFKLEIEAAPNDWVQYEVPFARLSRSLTGDASGAAAWDPTQLRRITFHLPAPAFDVWVDDLQFYSSSSR